MKLFLLFIVAVAVHAQGTINFPQIPLPAGVFGTANYNQLGSPKITGSLGGIYPLAGSAGIYGVTEGMFYPKLTKDATTGTNFYALNITFQQEAYKDLVNTGHFSFLIGGGLGTALSSNSTSLTVNLSTSLTFATVYQINKALSAVIAVGGQFISSEGWNLMPRGGLIVNLGNLSK